MQIIETKKNGLEYEFTVVISNEEIQKEITEKLDKMKNQANVPGFRPGKTPHSILYHKYNDSLMEDVLNNTVNKHVEKILTDKNLNPVVHPEIIVLSFGKEKDLKFKAKIEVYPVFNLIDFSTLSFARDIPEISDNAIANIINNIAKEKGSKKTLPADNLSKKGNIVRIDFSGTIDGKNFEGGEGKNFDVEIGSGTFLKDFENNLINRKSSESISFKVKLPDNYPKSIAGKEAEFHVLVKKVQEIKLARINDTFAKKVGYKSLDDLKKSIHTDYEKQCILMSDEKIKNDIFHLLLQKHNFSIPKSLINQELDILIRQVENLRKSGKETPETKGKSLSSLRESYKHASERRIKLGLIFQEIGKKSKISIDQQDIHDLLPSEKTNKNAFEKYKKNTDYINRLKHLAYEKKVIEYICKFAKVEKKIIQIENYLK